jgi:uncharacterized protein DUF1877
MGAIMYVCRIDGAVVGKLLSREKSADEYFSECHRSGGSEHDNEGGENVWIDLDKAWFAIHFLLTEGREDTALPAGALLGGTSVGGLEFAWLVLTVQQTASFAAYVATKPDDIVERSPRFAAAVPEAWNNAQMMQYVARHFRKLKRFVALAAAKGDGLMTSVSV